MLLLSYVSAVLLLSFLDLSSASWGYVQHNGQVRLLGSSFGIAGVNSTFDYVVCPLDLYSLPA